MLNKLESVLMPLAEKIGKNKYLMAIRDGFLLSMPLLIVGSFFLLIANFPIPGWNDFWGKIFGENWTSCFAKPTDATFTIMAIFAVVGIGYSFAEQMNVDKLFGAAISMVCWFLIMPYEIISGDVTVTGIPLGWVGSAVFRCCNSMDDAGCAFRLPGDRMAGSSAAAAVFDSRRIYLHAVYQDDG